MEKKRMIVCIIPKSPLPSEGRVGSIATQDWFQTCLAAVSISKIHNCPIFVSSAFRSKETLEADYYQQFLQQLGAKEIVVQYDGMETISHLDAIFTYAKKNEVRPIIISTILHCPRVKFIASRHKYPCEHREIAGTPRPSEAKTDRILNYLFPFIHWFGLEKLFVEKTTNRRKEGKI